MECSEIDISDIKIECCGFTMGKKIDFIELQRDIFIGFRTLMYNGKLINSRVIFRYENTNN